jgi:predicted nucleic acid-binding protein
VNYLLDTCVISEIVKMKPSLSCMEWLKNHHESSYFLSVLTIGELRKGISKLNLPKKRVQLEQWMNLDFIPRFQSRILPIDERVASQWGDLLAKSESAGKVLPAIDSLIAATAHTHSLTIVTRNVKDFQNLGIEILNPF